MKQKRSIRKLILGILLLFLFLALTSGVSQILLWRDISRKNQITEEKTNVIYVVSNEVEKLISLSLGYLSDGRAETVVQIRDVSDSIGMIIREREDVFSASRDAIIYSRVVEQSSKGIYDYFLSNVFLRLDQLESFDKRQIFREGLSELQRNLLDMVYVCMRQVSEEVAQNNAHYFRMSSMFNTVFLIVLFFLLVPLCFSVFNVLKQLGAIKDTAQALSHQDWETPDLDLSKYEELSITATAFNNMKQIIQSNIQDLEGKIVLEQELARTERLIQEAKYELIQAQINPHFLFNSLNMIVRNIQMGSDRQETAGLLISLSTLLRKSIEVNSRVITLEEELSLLDYYIQIQKARNDHRISFFVEVEDSLPQIMIPPFTLQPLVENSISHGLKDSTNGGEVRVQVFSDEEDVYISVSDNGSGIDRDKANAILEGRLETHGLQNVVKRLRMTYSNEDVVRIIQEEPGVSIVIRLNKGDFIC